LFQYPTGGAPLGVQDIKFCYAPWFAEK
jgi:hypothetical protein